MAVLPDEEMRLPQICVVWKNRKKMPKNLTMTTSAVSPTSAAYLVPTYQGGTLEYMHEVKEWCLEVFITKGKCALAFNLTLLLENIHPDYNYIISFYALS